MKSYTECLQWMEDVKRYASSAPEGVYMAHTDRVVTVRDVDPAAISELQLWFDSAQGCGSVHPIMQWKTQLEGSPDGEYYSLTITRGAGTKRNGDAYRFFYRKVSNRTRREAYDYAV